MGHIKILHHPSDVPVHILAEGVRTLFSAVRVLTGESLVLNINLTINLFFKKDADLVCGIVICQI